MWSRWLGSVGADKFEPAGRLVFDHGSFCYQAALDGAGVAMAETVMVESDISAGRLFYPFLQRYKDELSYYFLYPRASLKSGVKEFQG
jgi:LysR family glycine cleavage system transcriptional activator